MQPLMPLRVAYGTLVSPIGTILGRLGSGRLGPIVIIRLSQPASRAGALAWLSLATNVEKKTNYYREDNNIYEQTLIL